MSYLEFQHFFELLGKHDLQLYGEGITTGLLMGKEVLQSKTAQKTESVHFFLGLLCKPSKSINNLIKWKKKKFHKAGYETLLVNVKSWHNGDAWLSLDSHSMIKAECKWCNVKRKIIFHFWAIEMPDRNSEKTIGEEYWWEVHVPDLLPSNHSRAPLPSVSCITCGRASQLVRVNCSSVCARRAAGQSFNGQRRLRTAHPVHFN